MILPAQKNHLLLCEKRKKRRIGLVVAVEAHIKLVCVLWLRKFINWRALRI